VSFTYLVKRTLFQIIFTLLLTLVALYYIIGYTDINQFLKDVFITFISDKDVREKFQEAINSHLDATIKHLMPWINMKVWWQMKVGRILSSKR
jgi:hypothetical protein